MRIIHVTPHLPPDQAANALLPFQLGEWARTRGDAVRFLAHPPQFGTREPREDVTWIPRRRRTRLGRLFRLDSIAAARRIRRAATPLVAGADVVHVHSNGLLSEMGSLVAHELRKPVVLTLYGTEIWHYRRKRFGPDLFTRTYRDASAVTFYSERLLERAGELGLSRQGCRAVYPPVADAFVFHDAAAKLEVRRGLGIAAARLLVNVKRLHPLAGQQYLIDALPLVLREHPDTLLVICGTGALLGDLQARARAAGVADRVRFAGLVDNAVIARYCAAADLFVLPSLLEALPTVAVEALACGTPVVSSDNPGGIELHGIFGDDVAVVAREQPNALADAVNAALHADRRTRRATESTIARRFRPDAVAAQYWTIYDEVTRG